MSNGVRAGIPFLSMLIPGIGQMTQGRVRLGVGMCVGFVSGYFLLSLSLLPSLALILILGIWTWSVADAFIHASRAMGIHAMLTKIKFICTLATFLFAGLTALLATILGVRFLAAGPFERLEVLQGATPPLVGGAWILAWSAWLAAYALDRLAGDPEAMRGLATRLADAAEKVADRTRKAASRDKQDERS